MIIDLASLKSYLDINSPNKDTELQPIVDFVNDFITRFCGLSEVSAPQTITRRVTSTDGRSILLPHLDISSITSITSDGLSVAEEDYYEEDGLVVFYTEVSLRPFGIEAQYEVPAYTPSGDLVYAGLELAKYYYKSEYKNSLSTGQGDTVSFEVSKTVPNKIRAVLVQHRVL